MKRLNTFINNFKYKAYPSKSINGKKYFQKKVYTFKMLGDEDKLISLNFLKKVEINSKIILKFYLQQRTVCVDYMLVQIKFLI